MTSVVHKVAISKASAQEFYDVCSAKLSNLPSSCPHTITEVQLLKGRWGKAGSKMSWSFVFDGHKLPHDVVLQALDGSKRSVTFDVTSGYLLDNYFKSFQFTVKAMQGVVRWTVEYEQKSGDQVEETIESLVRKVTEEIDGNI